MLGFSVLSKDTLTCGQWDMGIEPLMMQLVDNQLYLLIHSHPTESEFQGGGWGGCRMSQKFILSPLTSFWLNELT